MLDATAAAGVDHVICTAVALVRLLVLHFDVLRQRAAASAWLDLDGESLLKLLVGTSHQRTRWMHDIWHAATREDVLCAEVRVRLCVLRLRACCGPPAPAGVVDRWLLLF